MSTNLINYDSPFIIKEVKFNNVTLIGIQDKLGKVFVSVKRICDDLGIIHHKQIARIKRDELLSEGATVLALPSQGGIQETFCLDNEYLAMFLTGISIKHCREEIRPYLLEFKRKAQKVLFEAFNNKTDKALPQTYPEALRQLAAEVEEKQLLLIENKKQSEYIEEHQPEIEFMNNLAQAVTRWKVTDVGRFFKQYGLGSNRIQSWLFEKGLLLKKGDNFWVRSQYSHLFQDVPFTKTYTTSSGGTYQRSFNVIWVLPAGFKKIGELMLSDGKIKPKELQLLSMYDIKSEVQE
jgi:phage antirepressor YoqD-like protein